MRKKRASSFSVIGGSSLLTVFAVVCLTAFAMLSLTTVQAQKRLSDSSIQSVERYYTADLEAERIFAQLRNGETVPGVVESEGIYAYRCPISDSQTLYVELEKTEESWRVLRWQAKAHPQKIGEELKVWDGSGLAAP